MKTPPCGIDCMQCGGVDVKLGKEWKAAFTATAAASGIGIVSGRQMVMFFAQMGSTSWLAVAAASVLFGLLTGKIAGFAHRTNCRSFAGVCMRMLSPRMAKAAVALYGLLMLSVSAAMLTEAGRLAELALPVHNAFVMGALLTLGLALVLCLHGMRGWGTAAVAVCTAFYIALAMDPRTVRIYENYETGLNLSGSVPAALVLGAVHAALCASMGAESMVSCGAESPIRAAAAAGVAMFSVLTVANAALMRGGERLLSQALPTVVLAARWGKTGFYVCILVKWMCAVATLASALGALTGKTPKGLES